MVQPNKAETLMLSLETRDPKKIALIAIATSSVETTKPTDCLLKLKPSSRVPTMKGNSVAGELPITSRVIPPKRKRKEVFSLFTYSYEYIFPPQALIRLEVKHLLVILHHGNLLYQILNLIIYWLSLLNQVISFDQFCMPVLDRA